MIISNHNNQKEKNNKFHKKKKIAKVKNQIKNKILRMIKMNYLKINYQK